MLFELGRLIATPDALDALQENNIRITELLIKHVGGDWGNLSDEDRLENEHSIKTVGVFYRVIRSIIRAIKFG